jgi:hypothetical protein
MPVSKDSASCELRQVLASSMSSFQDVCDDYSRDGYIGHPEKGLKLIFLVTVLCLVVKVAVLRKCDGSTTVPISALIFH